MVQKFSEYFIDFFLPDTAKGWGRKVDRAGIIAMRLQILFFNLLFVLTVGGTGLYLIGAGPGGFRSFPLLPAGAVIFLGTNILLKYTGRVLGPWVLILVTYSGALVRFADFGGIRAPGAPLLIFVPVLIFMMGGRLSGYLSTALSLVSILLLWSGSTGTVPAIPSYFYATVLTVTLIISVSATIFLLRENARSAEISRIVEQKEVSRILTARFCNEIGESLGQCRSALQKAGEAEEIPPDLLRVAGEPLDTVIQTLQEVGRLTTVDTQGQRLD